MAVLACLLLMQCSAIFVIKCLGNEALYIVNPIPSPSPRKRPTKIPRDEVILLHTRVRDK